MDRRTVPALVDNIKTQNFWKVNMRIKKEVLTSEAMFS